MSSNHVPRTLAIALVLVAIPVAGQPEDPAEIAECMGEDPEICSTLMKFFPNPIPRPECEADDDGFVTIGGSMYGSLALGIYFPGAASVRWVLYASVIQMQADPKHSENQQQSPLLGVVHVGGFLDEVNSGAVSYEWDGETSPYPNHALKMTINFDANANHVANPLVPLVLDKRYTYNYTCDNDGSLELVSTEMLTRLLP